MKSRFWAFAVMVFILFPGCSGSQKAKDYKVSSEKTTIEKNSPKAQPSQLPIPGSANRSAGHPGSEKLSFARIPKDLFKIQKRAERKEEYKQLAKRMIGDLEDEIKWQEKLETLKASASQKMRAK